MKLQATAHRVDWNGGHLNLPIRVKEAIRLGDRILVVYDYMAYPAQAPAPNLVAYAMTGERLWVAENLTASSPTDAYVGFQSEEPLWVYNFDGFRCRIDPETGRLLEREFTK